jgi:toxin ParE1/3/4
VSSIVRRSSANRDLVTIFRHYAREAGVRVADRFFTAAESTVNRLASAPGIGTLYAPDEPLYADVRYFPVTRFRVYLVFYRPIPNGIEVLRILHGARDLPGLLAEEFGIQEDSGDDVTEMTDESG